MRLIKERSFYKQLCTLAVPIVLQNFVTYCVTLADNLMIGSLGDSAVSGVYMGSVVQSVLQVLTLGIEAAILLLCAQYWGRRDTASIRKIIKLGMTLSLFLGTLATVVCTAFPEAVLSLLTDSEEVIVSGAKYLGTVSISYIFFCTTQSLIASMRSVESPKIGLFVSMISLVVDIVLNWVLIFGKFGLPALGIEGAAIATLIARVCETFVIVVYVLFIDKKLRLITRQSLRLPAILHFDRVLLRDFVRYGTPLVVGQIVWGINLTANSIIMGRFSQEVITAVSLANTINNLIFVMSTGLASAVGIMTGKKIGAGDVDDIREWSNTIQLIFITLGLLSSVLLLSIREPFISLYSISEQAAAYSKQLIGVLSVTIIGSCYQAPCLFGLVKSGGDVSFVFKNDSFFVFCVVIPSAAITALLGCEAWVVFFCLKCDQIFKSFVAFFKIRRYNWMKNLTR